MVRRNPVEALWFTHVVPGPLAEAAGKTASPGPAGWVETLATAAAADGRVSVEVVAKMVERTGRHSGGHGFSRIVGPVERDGVRYRGLVCTEPGDGPAAVASRWRGRAEPEGLLDAAAALARVARPELVHVHGTEGPFGLLACRSDVNAPVVVSLQGIVTAWRPCVLRGLTAGEVLRLALDRPTVKGWGVLHEYRSLGPRSRRERRVMRSGALFLGRTAWDRAVLRRLAPSARYAPCGEILGAPFYTTCNPLAADGSADAPAAEGSVDGPTTGSPAAAVPRAGGPTVFSTSSDLPGKGTEGLLEAFARLRRVLPARLRIAGVSAGSQLDALYRRRARECAVDDTVFWLGRLDAAALAAELASADVFAYPSHADNSPNSLCEAMMVGAPCAATAVGGVPSLLDDGEEGILVPDGEPAALAAAIEGLLGDRAWASRLARAARRRALRRHDPSRVVDELVAAYRTALGGDA